MIASDGGGVMQQGRATAGSILINLMWSIVLRERSEKFYVLVIDGQAAKGNRKPQAKDAEQAKDRALAGLEFHFLYTSPIRVFRLFRVFRLSPFRL